MGLGSAVEAFLVDPGPGGVPPGSTSSPWAALAKDLGSDVEVASISRDDLRAFRHARHHTAAAKTWRGRGRVQVARTRAIPLEELEAFLSAPRHAPRERLLWRMLYETAARAQEILLLDVGDLDLANTRAMVIGKGGKRRAHQVGDRHRPAPPALPRRAERRAVVPLQPGTRAVPPAGGC